MKQFWIAVDQTVNTCVWSKYENRFGMADETLSARCWRLHRYSKNWNYFKIFVDYLFSVFGVENHCEKSFISEMKRKQLPKEYRSI